MHPETCRHDGMRHTVPSPPTFTLNLLRKKRAIPVAGGRVKRRAQVQVCTSKASRRRVGWQCARAPPSVMLTRRVLNVLLRAEKVRSAAAALALAQCVGLRSGGGEGREV